MADIKQIIREEVREFKLEEIQTLLESYISDGVADRYAEKQFDITDPGKAMDQKAVQGLPKDNSMGEYVGEVFYNGKPQSKLYFEPSSLKNFGAEVKAISNKNGDIFIAQNNGSFLHFDIGKTIMKNGKYELSNGAYDETNNITWRRVDNSNTFGYGESMSYYINKNINNKQDAERRTIEVQKKHPEFKFIPELYWGINKENATNESLTDEGIADRYAEKNFNIPDSGVEQNLKAMQGLLGKPATVINIQRSSGNLSVPIYLNPRTLEGFDADVRAIAVNNGDLYVMQMDVDIMHGKMGQALGLKNVYDSETDVLLHRVGLTNEFGFGDSGSGYAESNVRNWKNSVEILRTTKGKNQQFDFYPIYFHDVKKIEAEPIDANGDDIYDNPVDMYGEPMFDQQQFEAVERSVDEIIEGVADRYAEKNFNISDPNKAMDKIAVAGLPKDVNNGELIAKMHVYDHGKYVDMNVYLNPHSLKEFDADVKAISTAEGDLIVAQLDLGIYHADVTANVADQHIYPKRIYNAYDESENITWHRIGTTNDFGWSISYTDFGRDPENQQVVREHTDAVKQRNPQFNFISQYWQEVRVGREDSTNNINNDNLYNGSGNASNAGNPSGYPIYSNMPHNQNR